MGGGVPGPKAERGILSFFLFRGVRVVMATDPNCQKIGAASSLERVAGGWIFFTMIPSRARRTTTTTCLYLYLNFFFLHLAYTFTIFFSSDCTHEKKGKHLFVFTRAFVVGKFSFCFLSMFWVQFIMGGLGLRKFSSLLPFVLASSYRLGYVGKMSVFSVTVWRNFICDA